MTPQGEVSIFDADGTRGLVERHEPGEQQMLVRFGERRFVLPAEMVTARDDGSYYLPARVAELERMQHPSESGAALVIPVIAEELDVHKRTVDRAKVRVTKVVGERRETVEEPVLEERIEVERVPVNRPADGTAEARYEGDTLIIPLVREVLVVEKRLMVTEEVHITKKRVSVQDRQDVTLRHEELRVERIELDNPAGSQT